MRNNRLEWPASELEPGRQQGSGVGEDRGEGDDAEVGPDSGWQERLEAGSWRLWTVFRRHPWAAAATGMTSEQFITGQTERRQQLAAAGDFPYFQRLIDSDYDFDIDRLFERGLRYLLDGVAASVAR